MTECCNTCRFVSGRGLTFCRRFPPVRAVPGDAFPPPAVNVFPEVDPRWWCGEYQPAGALAAKAQVPAEALETLLALARAYAASKTEKSPDKSEG